MNYLFKHRVKGLCRPLGCSNSILEVTDRSRCHILWSVVYNFVHRSTIIEKSYYGLLSDSCRDPMDYKKEKKILGVATQSRG